MTSSPSSGEGFGISMTDELAVLRRHGDENSCENSCVESSGSGPSCSSIHAAGPRASDPVSVPGLGSRSGSGSEGRNSRGGASTLVSSLVERERSSLGSSPISSPRVSIAGFDTSSLAPAAPPSNLSRVPSYSGLLRRTLSREFSVSDAPGSPQAGSQPGGALPSARDALHVESVPEEQQAAASGGDERSERSGAVSEEDGAACSSRSAQSAPLAEAASVLLATTPVPIPAGHHHGLVHDSLTTAAALPSLSLSPLNPSSSRLSFSSSLLSSPSPTGKSPFQPSPSRSFGRSPGGELSRLLLGTFEQSLIIRASSSVVAPRYLLLFTALVHVLQSPCVLCLCLSLSTGASMQGGPRPRV